MSEEKTQRKNKLGAILLLSFLGILFLIGAILGATNIGIQLIHLIFGFLGLLLLSGAIIVLKLPANVVDRKLRIIGGILGFAICGLLVAVMIFAVVFVLMGYGQFYHLLVLFGIFPLVLSLFKASRKLFQKESH